MPVAATDPLYILYTSGTTGQPKGVVRDNGGHMVALKWTMHNLYGVEPGEVYWCASDVGWVVGHSYIVYAPLLHGCTSDPLRGQAGRHAGCRRLLARHRRARRRRAVHRADRLPRHQEGGPGRQAACGNYDLSRFRTLFLAGERADPDTVQWAEAKLGVPVIDHWWQTETGWAIAGNPVGLGHAAGEARLADGADARLRRCRCSTRAASRCRPNTMGTIAIKLPLPPGCLPTLWNADERFRDSYLTDFPGYYKTSDAGFIDEDGYVYVMGRTDDIINVAGHRLSTGGMEEVLASHPDVAECAVIGVEDALKGEVPCGFVVLKAGVADGRRTSSSASWSGWCARRSARSPPSSSRSPSTACRRRAPARSCAARCRRSPTATPWTMPATIDDPAILDEIAAALKGKGVGAAA